MRDFILFGLKQAWACLFGGVMLAAILLSKWLWQPEWFMHRYDALFLFALIVQIIFIATGLESKREAKVIFLFHLVGTVMEVFKTAKGSWIYPEASVFRIGGVPLFTGFMYACVGSYMARVMHVLDLRFSHYPPLWQTASVAVLIYLNFFTHHYVWDARWVLFALVFWVWRRSWLHFRPAQSYYRMPVLVGFVLTAFFIWVAENIGTFTATWAYPNQAAHQLVNIQKIGSWFLLMIISCVLVTLVNPPKNYTKENPNT